MPSLPPTTSTPLILALDTSSTLGSVALSRGETLIETRAFEGEHGHSQRLLPAVEAVFAEAGLAVGDVDLFAVVSGPGSFTGLRVSLACLRGLAGTRPCFAALATDVAAWAARGKESRVLAVTDLFHGEVFASVHDAEGALLSERESGELGAVLATLGEKLRPGPAIATGSAAMKHRAEIESAFPGILVLALDRGLAPHLASLAAAKASSATTSASSDILPFYLRDPLSRGLLHSKPRGSG